jgi:sugar phosphate isomerase/epimerase
MRNHADRITSMHLKDRRTKPNGQANLPWGTGDTPVIAALKVMRDQKYRFPATIELEYDIPAGSNAVKEVRNCLDYCRKALES